MHACMYMHMHISLKKCIILSGVSCKDHFVRTSFSSERPVACRWCAGIFSKGVKKQLLNIVVMTITSDQYDDVGC